MNIDSIMAELAQYIRMQEEAAAMVESLKDQLKERMAAADVIWWISEDRRTSGSINGREYARIVNGIPYRIDN